MSDSWPSENTTQISSRQFEISDAMKKSKATKLLTSYHDPRQPGSLGGVTRFAWAQKLPVREVQET